MDHKPALGQDGHPAARIGDEQAEPQKPELAVCEGAKARASVRAGLIVERFLRRGSFFE